MPLLRGAQIPLRGFRRIGFDLLSLGIDGPDLELVLLVTFGGAAALSLQQLFRCQPACQIVQLLRGRLVALRRRGGEPEISLGQIVGHAQAVEITQAQIQLRLNIALLGRLPEPLRRFRQIIGHALPIGVEHAQIQLRRRVPLLCGQPKPPGRFDGVRRHAQTQRVDQPHVEACRRIGLVRGQAEKLQRIRELALLREVQAQLELRARVPGIGGAAGGQQSLVIGGGRAGRVVGTGRDHGQERDGQQQAAAAALETMGGKHRENHASIVDDAGGEKFAGAEGRGRLSDLPDRRTSCG